MTKRRGTTPDDNVAATDPAPGIDAEQWGRPARPRVRNTKRSELLARDIVEEILARGLMPGDLLPPEAAMLDHYGVGRASLREALRLLEIQGLVRLKPGPGGGPVVGEVEPANLGRTASLYFRLGGATRGLLAEAMLILDPWLAELAAERAEPAHVEAVLGPCLQAGDDAAGDPEAVWRAAPDFHDAVYELSGNGVLETIACAVGAIFRTQVLRHLDLSGAQADFLADHHRLAEAILAADSLEARRLAHQHMRAIIEVVNDRSPGLMDKVIEWR